MDNVNIPIVEDDADINRLLCAILEGAGYTCRAAFSGSEALLWAEKYDYDLVLLDLMLPGCTGEEFIQRIRRGKTMPIIVVSAKMGISDRVNVLKLGADDFIPKPFDNAEVVARVRSQLRRYTTLGGMEQKPSKLVTGGIVMDDEAKTVTVDGDPVSLTPIEYNILHLLMSHPGRVYSSAQIYEQVWNESAFGSEGAVAVHIRHLREKLEIDPSNPRYLKVVWGLGYKMEP